jgi:uncharacterized protein
MIKQLVLAAAIVLSAGPVLAEPASEASVERLFAIIKPESTLDAMFVGAEQMMRQALQQVTTGKALTSEQQRMMDSVPAKFVAFMRSEYTWEKMKPQYVQLYRETFSQEEIDGLVTFYESKPGQALVDKMPIVLQKSFAISQAQMQALMPKMRAAIEEAVRDAKVGN